MASTSTQMSRTSTKRKRPAEESTELHIPGLFVPRTRAAKRMRHDNIDKSHLIRPEPIATTDVGDGAMLDVHEHMQANASPATGSVQTTHLTDDLFRKIQYEKGGSAPEQPCTTPKTAETTLFSPSSSVASERGSGSSLDRGDSDDTEITEYSEPAKTTSNASAPNPPSKITCSEKKWNKMLNNCGRGLTIHEKRDELKKFAVEGGEISDKDLRDLDNDIPSFLDQQSWPMIDWTTEENNKLWEELLPSLRLVGMLLRESKVKDYFRHLALGTVVYRPKSEQAGKKSGKKPEKPRCKYIHESPAEQEARKNNDYSSIEAGIRVLVSKGLSFYFGLATLKDGFQCQGCCCKGEEHFPHNVCLKEDSPNFPRGKDKTRIVLHDTMRLALLNEDLTKEQKCLTMFNIAGTLLHELSHAFWSRHRNAGDPWEPEPCYNILDTRAELGEALEAELFGTRFAAVTTAKQGSEVAWQPLLRGSVGSQATATNSHLSFPLDPKWCHHLFSKEKWREAKANKDPDAMKNFFHPPSEFGVAQDGFTKKFRAVSREKSRGPNSIKYWENRDFEGIKFAVGKLYLEDEYGYSAKEKRSFDIMKELELEPEKEQRSNKRRKK